MQHISQVNDLQLDTDNLPDTVFKNRVGDRPYSIIWDTFLDKRLMDSGQLKQD